jgi:hypothetical protein
MHTNSNLAYPAAIIRDGADDDDLDEVFDSSPQPAAHSSALIRKASTLYDRMLNRTVTLPQISLQFRKLDWWNAPHFLVSEDKPTAKLFLNTLLVWVVPIALVVIWMLIPLGERSSDPNASNSVSIFSDRQTGIFANSTLAKTAAVSQTTNFGAFYLVYSLVMAYCAGASHVSVLQCFNTFSSR